MNKIPKITILLEPGKSFDRQLLVGISQFTRLHDPWAIHMVYENLEQVKPPPRLWEAAGMIVRLSSVSIADAVRSAKIPIVVVDCCWKPLYGGAKPRIARVSADAEGIIQVAIDHLSDHGFKHFALVGPAIDSHGDGRNHAFEDTVKRLSQPIVIYPSAKSRSLPWTRERERLVNWLKQLPMPIGIVACDDERGLQVLEACQSARLSVPNEVAVVGAGNDELLCSISNPPLSSVSLHATDAGYQAARLLDQLIQGRVQGLQRLVIRPNKIVVRASSDIAVTHDPDVDAARKEIHRYGSHKLSIAAMAKTIGISRRSLEQKFRKHVGRTILEEIHRVRLTKAKQLLKETRLPISQVASLSGYRSLNYLITVFGREVGVTPAKFRALSNHPELSFALPVSDVDGMVNTPNSIAS